MRQRTFPGFSSMLRMGRANAAVFPDPVWDEPITSFPDRICGMACAWIGVGRSYPASAIPLRTASERPSSENVGTGLSGVSGATDVSDTLFVYAPDSDPAKEKNGGS